MSITKQQAIALVDTHLDICFENFMSDVCNELIGRVNDAMEDGRKKAKGSLRVGYYPYFPYYDVKLNIDQDLVWEIVFSSISSSSVPYKKITTYTEKWDLRYWIDAEKEIREFSFGFWKSIFGMEFLNNTGKKFVEVLTNRLSKYGFALKFSYGGEGRILIKYSCAVASDHKRLPLHGGMNFAKQLAGTKKAIIELFDGVKPGGVTETQDEVSYVFNMSSDKLGRFFRYLVDCDGPKHALNVAIVLGSVAVEDVERAEELLQELNDGCLKELGIEGSLAKSQGYIMLRQQTIIEEDTDTYEICMRMTEKILKLCESDKLVDLVAISKEI